MRGSYRKRPLAERFWPKVGRGGPDQCWPFMGSRNAYGYGSFRGANGKTMKAHRVAWQLAHPDETLSSSDHVCHHCDNPPCCNPAHLYRGDYATNTRDKVARGRHLRGTALAAVLEGRMPRGADHWTQRQPITRCKRGHDLAVTAVRSGARRRCGACAADAQRERLARKRAA